MLAWSEGGEARPCSAPIPLRLRMLAVRRSQSSLQLHASQRQAKFTMHVHCFEGEYRFWQLELTARWHGQTGKRVLAAPAQLNRRHGPLTLEAALNKSTAKQITSRDHNNSYTPHPQPSKPVELFLSQTTAHHHPP